MRPGAGPAYHQVCRTRRPTRRQTWRPWSDKDLVGHGIYSRDGSKLGKVKAVIGDEMGNKYLIVGRFLSRDLVVPLHVVKLDGDRVIVPRTSSYGTAHRR